MCLTWFHIISMTLYQVYLVAYFRNSAGQDIEMRQIDSQKDRHVHL